eukprot:m.167491 g.167491  ORF g.167491 m.167491 type:complete len:54 (+) comp9903_c0_seq3:587-748(+)
MLTIALVDSEAHPAATDADRDLASAQLPALGIAPASQQPAGSLTCSITAIFSY